MAKQLQKLELTWIGKGNEPKLEPRILIEDPSKSFGDPKSENMLIHGDNLLALKALEQQFAGKIKCVAVDPPYNTGSAFQHYDDGIEHSLWLSLMNDRIKMFHKLLANDGSIWIAIDDNEAHYLKVLCDEIFGRQNFIANVIWEKADSPRMDAKFFSSRHDHILVYCKDINHFKINKVSTGEDGDNQSHYNKTDKNGVKFYLKPLRAMGAEGTREARPTMYYSLIAPDGSEVYPKNPDGSDSRWRWSKERMLEEKDRVEWIKTKNGWSANYRVYASENSVKPPETIWTHLDAGSNRTSKKEVKAFVYGDDKPFDTPKPEKLLKRIIEISTNENDYVLDSFLGSGTTSAVAHKMKRKWIGIELGEHANTHCIPRLHLVVTGKDKGGITEAVNWKGGGGFKFYTLAPSLVQKDKYGTEIINPQYNANMLAAAMAKQEGFRYQPDENNYWKQGMSSEKDFIFTTTQFVTVAMLDKLAEELQPGESLLVCCKSFAKGCANRHTNITIKKIPQMLLGRCEFGKDDYSFNIVNLPHDNDDFDIEESEESEAPKPEKKSKAKKQKDDDTQSSLF
jgi:adenine-specific DNA-methyltransferase